MYIDPRLHWRPEDWENLTHLYVRTSNLWTPEIRLCNVAALDEIEPMNGEVAVVSRVPSGISRANLRCLETSSDKYAKNRSVDDAQVNSTGAIEINSLISATFACAMDVSEEEGSPKCSTQFEGPVENTRHYRLIEASDIGR